jgi:hypothetical protein
MIASRVVAGSSKISTSVSASLAEDYVLIRTVLSSPFPQSLSAELAG